MHACEACPHFSFTIEIGVQEHLDRIKVRAAATSSSAAILGEIESVGWRLEHVGYIYMITSETSSDRMLLTGQATAVSGVTIGVYLFRSTAPE